ncbi:hypothetical protein SUDANB15_02552 [Streptomyces sp. enrichment culture]|uniref:hypothetical protein n=1 Tax=Streptomyces sp. enrichment culture TaxID=1795815 RepID=UPI003F57B42D
MDVNKIFGGLFPGARQFAQSALDALSKEDEQVFLLHAGVSIERLAKAVLAQRSPFLLLEMKGNEDALFQIAGLEQRSKIRTIGAATAIARLKRLGVLPQAKDTELDELIELRNGVAHLTAAHDGSFDALAKFVGTSTTLLTAWGKSDPEHYWGPHYGLVELTLSEVGEKAARHFSRLIEQARYRLAQRAQALPQTAMEALLKERSINVTLTWPDTRTVLLPHKCPACGNFGALLTGPPVLITSGKPGEAVPKRFVCFICDLDLKSTEELASAGLDKRVPLVNLNGERVLTEAEEALWHQIPDGDDPEKWVTR